MKKISVAALFCTLIFAIAAFAMQNPTMQRPSTPGAAPPSQSPQMPSPSQGTPSTQPDQSTSPSQSPSSQPPQARMSNIDEQVKVLSDQLSLTPDQQGKVKSILMDQHEQAMALTQDNSMAREAKIEKIHSLRSNTIDKVRGLLTAEQKPKFDQMVQQQDDRLKQQHQEQPGSGNSPSSTSPNSQPPTNQPNTKPPQ